MSAISKQRSFRDAPYSVIFYWRYFVVDILKCRSKLELFEPFGAFEFEFNHTIFSNSEPCLKFEVFEGGAEISRELVRNS